MTSRLALRSRSRDGDPDLVEIKRSDQVESSLLQTTVGGSLCSFEYSTNHSTIRAVVAVVKKISKWTPYPPPPGGLGGRLARGSSKPSAWASAKAGTANEWRSFLEVQGHPHQMRNRASFEFAHDRGAVMLRGSGGDVQPSRDDLGGKALDQQVENLVLALRQEFAA